MAVRHDQMASQLDIDGTHRPDMQVMDIHDAGQSDEEVAHLGRIDMRRHARERLMQRVALDTLAAAPARTRLRPSEQSGSTQSQPVSQPIRPDRATAADTIMSASMCQNAARRLRSFSLPPATMAAQPPLTSAPANATAMTTQRRCSAGASKGCLEAVEGDQEPLRAASAPALARAASEEAVFRP